MDQTVSENLLEQMDHNLILASRVNGTAVFNKDGEHLGQVDDLSIEKVSGKVVYAIMSFGGILGFGEKFHPVPWSLLDYDPERGGFVVPMDQSDLADAPGYDLEKLRELGGPDYRRHGETIFGYYGRYGVVPYW